MGYFYLFICLLFIQVKAISQCDPGNSILAISDEETLWWSTTNGAIINNAQGFPGLTEGLFDDAKALMQALWEVWRQ